MESKDALEAEEERIREQVRAMSDAQRAHFHRKAERLLKDPDTYAVLNYLFIAGLHHFYLGKWRQGLLNIAVFWFGVLLIVTGQWELGLAIILVISALELFELFRAQRIVLKHNNAVLARLYDEAKRQA
ncbi:MAG: TM2 domain-containing protein [Saccharospirillum sp.]